MRGEYRQIELRTVREREREKDDEDQGRERAT